MDAGIEEHEFYFAPDEQAIQVWGSNNLKDIPLSNTGWQNGKELSTKYYKSLEDRFVLVKEVNKIYKEDSSNYHEAPSLVVRKKYDLLCQEQATITCTAADTCAKTTVRTCTANHDHEWRIRSWAPIECKADDPHMEDVDIYFHPCYGEFVGTEVIVKERLIRQ